MRDKYGYYNNDWVVKVVVIASAVAVAHAALGLLQEVGWVTHSASECTAKVQTQGGVCHLTMPAPLQLRFKWTPPEEVEVPLAADHAECASPAGQTVKHVTEDENKQNTSKDVDSDLEEKKQ